MAARSPNPRAQGYCISTQNTRKPNIEDQIREAFYSPSPQTYNPIKPGLPTTTAGGLISGSKKPPSALNAPKHHGANPGPGKYDPPGAAGFALPEGGRVNTKAPVEKFKIDEFPKPAPGAYGVPSDAQLHPRPDRGSKMSKDPKHTEFIRVEERRGRSIPGPGAHDVLESMDYVKPLCPEGGRWHTAEKPLGYFEQVTHILRDHPEPGAYHVTADVQPREVGRLVYKYESATIRESKELVRKIAGDRHEVPGPGAYTVPDLPPVNPSVPELRGREAGLPLPPPFAYNCGTNHSGSYASYNPNNPHSNYSKYTPVRQKNSGAQIWGNGVRRKPGQSTSSQRGSPTAASQVVMDPGMPLDDASRDDAVQWKHGGFTQLKHRSKSEGALRVHPSFELLQKQYEALSKETNPQRDRRTFLPMASKRAESVRVSVGSNSSEYHKLEQGKWALDRLAENIKAVGSDVLEKLDEDKLRRDAMMALRDKARERMRLEGVALDKQEAVLSEMAGVLDEHSKEHSKSTMVSTFDGESGPESFQDQVALASA